MQSAITSSYVVDHLYALSLLLKSTTKKEKVQPSKNYSLKRHKIQQLKKKSTIRIQDENKA